MGLSLTIDAGPRQRSYSGFRVRGTHDHILLCQIRDFPNLEGQVPVFISPRNRVAHLYPQTLRSILVASYHSQGCGGGILIHLHTRIWTTKRVLVITSQLAPVESTSLLLLFKLFPWEYVLFVKALPSNGSGIFAITLPLLSNGCCFVVYFEVVIQ
jgi:hypothetical protein